MSYCTHPQSISNFRESTEKVAVKMAGAIFITFWCPECDKSKPVKGRKYRGYKAGFRCACCHEERQQRIWNKAQQQADNVKHLRSQEAKDRQVVLLCETLKTAINGGE